MLDGLTPSEKYVIQLCKNSFLKIWTHPNPVGKKGKELCDCLIVCDSHIVIISVKEIEYKNTGDKIGFERWEKSAIKKSVSQIAGAEKWLRKSSFVKRHDGRRVSLPEEGKRNYHRISVSLGGKGEVFLKMGDFGKGYVHVFDEKALEIIFQELDTINDFVDFLIAVEGLQEIDFRVFFSGGGVEDLLALYLSQGCSFDKVLKNYESEGGMMMIESGIWDSFSKSEDYTKMKNEREVSYVWDRLIEYYAEDLLSGGFFDIKSKEVSDNELALATMALQRRNHRWNLSQSLEEFWTSKKEELRSRLMLGDNNTAFVLLYGKSTDRKARYSELFLRSFVARVIFDKYEIKTIIGISFDRPGSSKVGYSSEIGYVHIPEISEDDFKKAKQIQEEFGYFTGAVTKRSF